MLEMALALASALQNHREPSTNLMKCTMVVTALWPPINALVKLKTMGGVNLFIITSVIELSFP